MEQQDDTSPAARLMKHSQSNATSAAKNLPPWKTLRITGTTFFSEGGNSKKTYQTKKTLAGFQ